MEIEDLKKEWKNIKTPRIELARLKDMTIEKSNPVLTGMRKQLTIELIGWSAFLVICFTGMDTDQKPILTNTILTISVALPMILNVYGYRLSKDLIEGPDIRSSLENRISSLRHFAIASVLLRIMLIVGVSYFFTDSIDIDRRKFILLGTLGVVLIFSLYLLVRIWTRRISKLSGTLRILKERS